MYIYLSATVFSGKQMELRAQFVSRGKLRLRYYLSTVGFVIHLEKERLNFLKGNIVHCAIIHLTVTVFENTTPKMIPFIK